MRRQERQKEWEIVVSLQAARIAELEEALRRIRDYATAGHRNVASMELTLDGVFKVADDALEKS
ncbi:hypothetical protein LCGC14_2434410 [marine sediment metagenome]|uniref:Uncharacterized protein n=1 Tax=marine sediment metagenome TaxID=412755 RepID=A0A0F9EEW1_9ZZZZ